MKRLPDSQLRMLQNLSNNGGSILWRNIGGPGKTASRRLEALGYAKFGEAVGSVFQPDQARLFITDAGRAALGGKRADK